MTDASTTRTPDTPRRLRSADDTTAPASTPILCVGGASKWVEWMEWMGEYVCVCVC